jgi:hypothetical protein
LGTTRMTGRGAPSPWLTASRHGAKHGNFMVQQGAQTRLSVDSVVAGMFLHPQESARLLAAQHLWRYKIIMSIDSTRKSTKGRPSVDSEAVNVRMERPQLTRLDDWRRRQVDMPSRPEAIRRLIDLGLAAKRPEPEGGSPI